MRMKIPITGTVIQVEPCILGEPSDPIRPILPLGEIDWVLIHLDLENELMEIEVTPGKSSATGLPTQADKQAVLNYAKSRSLEMKTKEELHALSLFPRLNNPFKVDPPIP